MEPTHCAARRVCPLFRGASESGGLLVVFGGILGLYSGKDPIASRAGQMWTLGGGGNAIASFFCAENPFHCPNNWIPGVRWRATSIDGVWISDAAGALCWLITNSKKVQMLES
jgi:hypothetical protein